MKAIIEDKGKSIGAIPFTLLLPIAVITIPLKAIIKGKSVRWALVNYAEFVISQFAYDWEKKTDNSKDREKNAPLSEVRQ